MSGTHGSLKTLFRGAGVVFAGIVAGRFLSLVGQVLIVRSLSPATFGRVVLAFTIALAATRVATVGVPEGVTRLVSAEDSPRMRREVIQVGVALVFAGSVVVAAAVYAFRTRIAAVMADDHLAAVLVLFVPYLLLLPLARVCVAVLRSQKRTVPTVLSRDVAPFALGIVAFVVLSSTTTPSLAAVAYWTALPAVTIVVALRYVNSEFPLQSMVAGVPSSDRVATLWSFSWPLALEGSFALLLSNLDVLMLGYFLDSGPVGQYRAVQPLREVTLFFLSSVVFLYLPLATEQFERGDVAGLNTLYAVSTKWVASATLPLVLLFALFASDVIALLFGDAYLPAAPALTVLTLGLYVRALVGPTGTTVKAIDRPRVELVASLAGVVTNVLLNWLLIPPLGIVGAALATGAGYAVFNLVEVAVIHDELGVHPFTANTLVPILPTVGVASLIHRALGGFELGVLALLVIGCVLAATHVVSMYLTGSITEDDATILEQLCEEAGLDADRIRRRLSKLTR